MAHNITYNSITGEWEVMTRGASWHNLGQVVQDCKTWQDTIQLAGLDWTVSKRQLEYASFPVPAWGLFRDDQTEVSKAFISPTTETYQVIQNYSMFTFLDALIEAEESSAHYEAAGSLNGGAQVFALVNIAEAFEVGASGDRFESYLLFTDDRTAKRSAKCFLTTVRVVCANTLQQALGQTEKNAEHVAVFRHSGNVHEKMASAVDMMTGARMNIKTLRDKLGRLAERTVTRETLVNVLDRLFPAQDEKSSARRDSKLIDILRLFEENDHNQFPEIRGTAYNLLNAVTEWTDHFVPVRRTAGRLGMTDDAIRAERAMVGDGSTLKAMALDVILEETANAPLKTRNRIGRDTDAVLDATTIE